MTRPNIAQSFEDLETGLTAQTISAFKQHVRSIIEDPHSLEDQKRQGLVDTAFKALPYTTMSNEAIKAIEDGIICLLGEGPTPYHPRYVAPDYQKLLDCGSEFFDLKPATNLHEAISSLLTVYNYSPTQGSPPFIGALDSLLEPFVANLNDESARDNLKLFWTLIDRLHPNAFVHGVIGPEATRTGRFLLDIDNEIQTITNLTLKYDPQITPKDYAIQAIRNAMHLSKPYFLNHPYYLDEWGGDYVIASCYNIMRLKGGIFTLVRLNLSELANRFSGTLDELLNETLPELAALQMEVINSRVEHLVEKVRWLDHSIFIKEGLLEPEKFTAYAGVVGLNELVNKMMVLMNKPECKYGHDQEANNLAVQILDKIKNSLMSHHAVHCLGSDEKIVFHAQVGISEDQGVTPGCRLPAGTEPDLYTHLRTAATIQPLISGGVSDIFEFDQTAKTNLDAVKNIIDGAMEMGVRNISIGCVDSEYVRVSGYLIRRVDLESREEEKLLRHDTAKIAQEFFNSQPNTIHRRKRFV